MFKPYELIGMPYRLGATPEKHQAVDCVSLARAVLKTYGIKSPEPERDWYRRLRRGDYEIFREQLQAWGVKTKEIKIGTVGLVKAANGKGYGLAVYWEGGWLSCSEELGARWSPIDGLQVVEYYCQQK